MRLLLLFDGKGAGRCAAQAPGHSQAPAGAHRLPQLRASDDRMGRSLCRAARMGRLRWPGGMPCRRCAGRRPPPASSHFLTSRSLDSPAFVLRGRCSAMPQHAELPAWGCHSLPALSRRGPVRRRPSCTKVGDHAMHACAELASLRCTVSAGVRCCRRGHRDSVRCCSSRWPPQPQRRRAARRARYVDCRGLCAVNRRTTGLDSNRSLWRHAQSPFV